jgi:hypothetical protein
LVSLRGCSAFETREGCPLEGFTPAEAGSKLDGLEWGLGRGWGTSEGDIGGGDGDLMGCFPRECEERLGGGGIDGGDGGGDGAD